MSNLNNSGKTILVVDDDPDARNIIRILLSMEGWQVQCAANGQEALDEVAKEAPDLIILDVMMPVMNGFDTLSQLKRNPVTRNIPVVISSAMGNDQRLKRLGAAKVLPKGRDIQIIATVVDEVLKDHKALTLAD